MQDPEREQYSSAEQPPEWMGPQTDELTWLIANRDKFFQVARDRQRDLGRGALIIEATDEFSDDTPFSYAPYTRIAAREDEVSQQLTGFVGTYNPQSEFVAVVVRPDDEFTFNMYKFGGLGEQANPRLSAKAERLEEQVDTPRLDHPQEKGSEPSIEPPDLDTLMAWESEGICEATDGCVVEPDGICPHGYNSWLLELGLI